MKKRSNFNAQSLQDLNVNYKLCSKIHIIHYEDEEKNKQKFNCIGLHHLITANI